MQTKPEIKQRIKPVFIVAVVLVAYCFCVGLEIAANGTMNSTLNAMMILAGTIVFMAFTAISEVEKTNADQQTQIDNLKRELEEMKQKQ